jgi:hypothetical protein
MTSFSGLSAILTISVIALATLQLMKDKFENVEYFGEVSNIESPMLNGTVRTPQQVSAIASSAEGQMKQSKANVHESHTLMNDNMSRLHEAYYVASMNPAGIPTNEDLQLIGSSTKYFTGPNAFTTNEYSTLTVNNQSNNNSRANNLSLCAQNMNTNAAVSSISSSLLPNPANTDEFSKNNGFNDCNVTNVLANQVFLTPSGRMGINTVSGSLRNSSQDLRAEPMNPIMNVSPWLNPSIYPDPTRHPLDGLSAS